MYLSILTEEAGGGIIVRVPVGGLHHVSPGDATHNSHLKAESKGIIKQNDSRNLIMGEKTTASTRNNKKPAPDEMTVRSNGE